MKTRISIGPLVLAALVAVGCKQPTHPSFAPSGASLAYEKGGTLRLRSSIEDREIGPGVEGDVAWSQDGSRIAFLSNQVTRILDLSTDRQVSVPNAVFPYSFTPFGLACVAGTKGTDTKLILIDPSTGDRLGEGTSIPFFPTGSMPLRGAGALFWNEDQTWLFDGIQARRLPDLAGFDPIHTSSDGTEVTYARKFTPHHTHRHLIEVWRWNPSKRQAPARLETIDLGSAGKVTYVLDVEGSGKGALVASLVRFEPKHEEAKELFALLDRTDYLNHIFDQKRQQDLDQRISRFAGHCRISYSVMIRRPGQGWSSIITKQVPRNDGEGVPMISVSSDGRKLAVSTTSGTGVYPIG